MVPKGKTSKKRPEVGEVKEKAVNPKKPTNSELRRQLKDDLTRMGCRGLYLAPWDLQS